MFDVVVHEVLAGGVPDTVNEPKLKLSCQSEMAALGFMDAYFNGFIYALIEHCSNGLFKQLVLRLLQIAREEIPISGTCALGGKNCTAVFLSPFKSNFRLIV